MSLFKKSIINFNFFVIIFLRIVLKNFLIIKKKIEAAKEFVNATIKVAKNGPNIYPAKRITGDIKPNKKTQINTPKEKIKINKILFLK